MPNKILKILLKKREDRTLFENLEIIKYLSSIWGRELKYYLTLDYYFKN